MNATYLITGGTGSLGRELISRVLASDAGAEAVVLIRGEDPEERSDKWEEICRYLRHYGHEAILPRVRLVAGDVVLPSLGLSSADTARLLPRVTHLIHAAANIQLNQPLETARAINVGGARRALELAERCDRLERFAHISTSYVAGDRNGVIREGELDVGQGFLNAYEQSKCEAEALVALHRGRLPITVFRPSIIVGDSRDGHTCNFGTLYHPLKRIAKGVLTEIPGDPHTPLDLVPVDYVADCVARLARDRRSEGRTYHIAAGARSSIPVGELVAATACFHRRKAPRFLAPLPRDRANSPRLGTFFAYLSGSKDFDDAALWQDMGVEGGPCPDPRVYLRTLLAFCQATNWGLDLPWERTAQGAAA